MSKTNSVRLIGHVGQNPKLVSTSTENCVITVTLATNEIYRDENGNKTTKTEWHNIVAFGRIANLFNQYVKRRPDYARRPFANTTISQQSARKSVHNRDNRRRNNVPW